MSYFFLFFWKNAVANYCTSKRFCSECNHSSFGQQLAKKNTLSQFKILYMAKKAEQNETWRQCLQRNSSSAFINCCDLIARTERGKLALDGQTLGLRWGLDEKGVLRNVSKISLNNRRKSVILHSVLFKADQQCPLYISFFQISTLSTVELVQNANWRQWCPVWGWSRLLWPLICLVWWALVEVIQPLNLTAYLSNSWANTHSPSALGLIFKHL